MCPKLTSAASLVITSALVAVMPARAQDDLALARTVAEANNAFGVALYREFAKEPGNLVFSPFSLSSALALTATGARGQTEKELWHALRLNLPREQVAAGYAGIAKGFPPSRHGNPPQVRLANVLCVRSGFALQSGFTEVAQGQFAAEVKPFGDGPPEYAAWEINNWVSEKTDELIPQLIDPATLTPDTNLLLGGVLCFDSEWSEQFPETATKPVPFFCAGGRVVDTPMMKLTERFVMVEDVDCKVLSIPYNLGFFDMVVVLPNKTDGLGELGQLLGSPRLNRWFEQLKQVKPSVVCLELPRFKITNSPDAQPALRRLGISTAFENQRADFSGIAIEPGLWIGRVVARAMIEVDENRTLAAAAASVHTRTIGISGPPPTPIPFKVDHPFLFFIRETRTGAILFMGRIVDPRAE